MGGPIAAAGTWGPRVRRGAVDLASGPETVSTWSQPTTDAGAGWDFTQRNILDPIARGLNTASSGYADEALRQAKREEALADEARKNKMRVAGRVFDLATQVGQPVAPEDVAGTPYADVLPTQGEAAREYGLRDTSVIAGRVAPVVPGQQEAASTAVFGPGERAIAAAPFVRTLKAAAPVDEEMRRARIGALNRAHRPAAPRPAAAPFDVRREFPKYTAAALAEWKATAYAPWLATVRAASQRLPADERAAMQEWAGQRANDASVPPPTIASTEGAQALQEALDAEPKPNANELHRIATERFTQTFPEARERMGQTVAVEPHPGDPVFAGDYNAYVTAYRKWEATQGGGRAARKP